MSDISPQSNSRTSSTFPLLFILILSAWGCLNIVQALLTEIENDEAYYWMYSRFLDWGYFDHPPMIALFVKAGSFLFKGELGVRFVTILAQLITVCLVWILIDDTEPSRNKILTFFGITASVVMFQVYGFIATPDSPLLLTTALFIWAYRKYLQKENLSTVLLLSISMAAMVYSKYHGALVIFFVLASNLRLLRSGWFWLAGILAVVAFTPHILWQIENDYPSLRYHLVTRSRPINIRHILNYIPNQLFSFNPFFLGLVAVVLYKFKPKDLFERGLYFIVGGFLSFFFISSVRGHVEPHWTIAASIPMIIIVYRKCIDKPQYQQYIHWVLVPTILILLILRSALMFDYLPGKMEKFHGKKEWYTRMASIAGDTPVVFRNSYQRPSVYSFYTGNPATSINGIYYRQTQYDIWPFEEELFGKEVILVTNVNDPLSTEYIFPKGKKIYLNRSSHFFAVQKLEIEYALDPLTVMQAGDTVTLDAEIYNPYPYKIDFHVPYFPVTFNVMFVKSGNDMTVAPATVSPAIDALAPGEKRKIAVTFEVPDICTRKYKFAITLQAGVQQEAFNSKITPIFLLEK
ncbi:MAG TPA: glycosyltransferase family 39 protein [Saprospiraceae bacterium]